MNYKQLRGNENNINSMERYLLFDIGATTNLVYQSLIHNTYFLTINSTTLATNTYRVKALSDKHTYVAPLLISPSSLPIH